MRFMNLCAESEAELYFNQFHCAVLKFPQIELSSFLA